MSILSIIYFSGTGHTAKLAEAVAKGAESVAGTKVHLLAIDGEEIIQGRYKNDGIFATLDSSDAIIFGSPTYMGGPAAQFKAFADATGGRWYGSVWRDKIASGFSISNSPSGDKFNTLQYFQTLAMQHGMIWVGLGEMPMQPNGVNRLGSFAGATAQAGQIDPEIEPNEADKLTGETLGKRVAEFATKILR
jgi:NAD(P)H dehydrogenase (quinone)